jgi:hypothetical protein
MFFEYHRIQTLPRLAWCAELKRGSSTVQVYHGPWVETRPDCFVEGAWAGDFAAGELDRSHTLIGTGARLTQNGVTFSTATDIDFYLYSLRVEDTLFISNSFVFPQVRGQASPDLTYLNYYNHLLRHRRMGASGKGREIPLADGKTLSLFLYQNIEVNDQLEIHLQSRQQPQEPDDFQAYFALLKQTMGAVFKNAADPLRKHPFTPISSVSRGYDSTAVTAIAAQLGCQEAISIADDYRGLDDNGAVTADILSMRMRQLGRTEFHEEPGFPEAEFMAASPVGRAYLFAPLAKALSGKILLLGNTGDLIWGLDEMNNMKNFCWPNSEALSVVSMNEFRLRVGLLVFSAPIIGAFHRNAIQKISLSQEMKPWSIGGEYDRPIPRRIAEEAGLPRESFGQQKMIGIGIPAKNETIKPETTAAYRQFLDSLKAPPSNTRFEVLLDAPFDIALRFLAQLKIPFLYKTFAPLMNRLTLYRFFTRRRPRKRSYFLHWGFEKVRDRYEF